MKIAGWLSTRVMPSCSATIRPSTTTRSARPSVKLSNKRPVRNVRPGGKQGAGADPHDLDRLRAARRASASSRTSRSSSSTSQQEPGVLDTVQPLEPALRVGRERVVDSLRLLRAERALLLAVGHPDLRRGERVEPLADLGFGGRGETGGGDERADADHGAQGGQERSPGSAGDRGCGFADQVADRQRGAKPGRTVRPRRGGAAHATTPWWTMPSRISTIRCAR